MSSTYFVYNKFIIWMHVVVPCKGGNMDAVGGWKFF